MESERLATNEQVGGSSPSVFANKLHGDECKASSNQFFKLNLVGSSPAFPTNHSGSSNGRTLGFEPGNIGSTPFPEAKLFQISNLKFQISPSTYHTNTGLSTAAIWACFGNKCSQVRILLPGPIIFHADVAQWIKASVF